MWRNEKQKMKGKFFFFSIFSLSSGIKLYILIIYVEYVTVFILGSNILSDQKIRDKFEEVIFSM